MYCSVHYIYKKNNIKDILATSRRFPNIFRRLPKIFKNSPKAFRRSFEQLEHFPKIAEYIRRLPRVAEYFRAIFHDISIIKKEYLGSFNDLFGELDIFTCEDIKFIFTCENIMICGHSKRILVIH